MTTDPKNKILIVIIAVLLLTNIVLVSFLLLNKPSSKKGMRSDRTALIAAFLEKELGFDQQQLKQYENISDPNRTKVSAMFEALGKDKEQQFKQLATDNFSDAAILKTADLIAFRQKEIDIVLYNHFKQIRNLCTPPQQPKFDSMFYKVLSKKFTSQKK